MKPSHSRRLPGFACTALLTAVIALVSACSNTQYAPSVPFYTLGGTVSGLSASGLVLANGGQTVTVNSGAQSFSFGPALVSGTSYEVTVQTQPAGQLCSVTDGAGTAATANVANVVVACAAQAYSVGGTVKGLTSSGLVLVNGSETLSVAAGATTFAFTTPVAAGSTYSVAVKTQPTGLACAVAKGTGTMPQSNVSSVAVRCTDLPFSLGGSISGLTTSGLELVNGADLLQVAANATSFKMPTAVPYGSAYAVTVHAQPTGLTCAVTHGSGTMPAAAVTNVTVVCADQTYLLGGAITGLTASGLVLANGADTLPVAANATGYTMPTAVPYGSPYAVTVQTQPAGLTCTVSNSTGNMPAGPLSDVNVTCAVSTFTIGGSITGLTTSGLVLANGTDTTPPLGATATMFTMPTGVVSGASYDVTVQTQPAGQLCTVSNGSGIVGSSDVTTVAVSCTSNVINYTTPGPYTWTVPGGVTSIEVVATGGGGGGGISSYAGGNGGVVTATLSVTPAQVLTLFVGGGGGGSTSSGGVSSGGGGSTNVDAGAADQVIAGGGGGAGGGAAGPATGGNGGGNGTGSGSNGDSGNPSSGSGGSGGIGGAGGPGNGGNGAAGGNGNGGPGGAGANGCGTAGTGGAGSGTGAGGAAGSICAGGGGGGGYGGGGGAGSGGTGDGGGGGGGSTGPAGATFTVGTNGGTAGANGGDGSIVITTNP